MTNEILPGKEDFFARIRTKITSERLITAIDVAYRIAKVSHKNQLRDDGQRYFDHVKAVAWIIITEINIVDQFDLTTLICIALLHDLMEDTFIATELHLHFIFDQISPEITYSAWDLTNPKEASKEEKWAKLLASISIFTLLVKAADRLHNSRTLSNCTPEKISRKKAETRDIILPWLRRTETTPKNRYALELEFLVEDIAELVAA